MRMSVFRKVEKQSGTCSRKAKRCEGMFYGGVGDNESDK